MGCCHCLPPGLPTGASFAGTARYPSSETCPCSTASGSSCDLPSPAPNSCCYSCYHRLHTNVSSTASCSTGCSRPQGLSQSTDLNCYLAPIAAQIGLEHWKRRRCSRNFGRQAEAYCGCCLRCGLTRFCASRSGRRWSLPFYRPP